MNTDASARRATAARLAGGARCSALAPANRAAARLLGRPRSAGTNAAAPTRSVEHCSTGAPDSVAPNGTASSASSSAAKRFGVGTRVAARLREFGGDRGDRVVFNGTLLSSLQQLLSSPPPTSHPVRPLRLRPRPPLVRRPPPLRGGGSPSWAYCSVVSWRKLGGSASIHPARPLSASNSARVYAT